MIGGSCYTNPFYRVLLRGYRGVQSAYYYLEFLMKRFRSKGEQRLRQLNAKFGQLIIAAAETKSEFVERTQECIVEIWPCNPSQVPTDKQIAIWAKAGLNFNITLHCKSLRKYYCKSIWIDEHINWEESTCWWGKKIKTANFAAVEIIIRKKNIQAAKLEIKKRNWTKKQSASENTSESVF